MSMLDHDAQKEIGKCILFLQLSHNNFAPDSNLPRSMRQVRRTLPNKDAKHRALLGLDSTEPVDRWVNILFQCPCVLKIQVLT